MPLPEESSQFETHTFAQSGNPRQKDCVKCGRPRGHQIHDAVGVIAVTEEDLCTCGKMRKDHPVEGCPFFDPGDLAGRIQELGKVNVSQETVLEEALRLVGGDRQESYGHPIFDFTRTAGLWTQVLGKEVTPQQVALCMILVKISREVNKHKRDNLVDIAGYARTLEMVWERLGAGDEDSSNTPDS